MPIRPAPLRQINSFRVCAACFRGEPRTCRQEADAAWAALAVALAQRSRVSYVLRHT